MVRKLLTTLFAPPAGGMLAAMLIWSISPQANAAWGAQAVPEQSYPATAWERRFAATPDIYADGNIEDAIDACDARVGAGAYCVVEISDAATRAPFEINRSRTKIVGFPGMRPLRTRNNRDVITVAADTRHVVIEGLEIRGHNAYWNEIYGIIVWGDTINGVIIRDNHLYGFASHSNAHAIAVFGTGATAPQTIRNVLIAGNHIHDMRTGSSETIAINGNVARWAIVDNDIRNVNNIAIDAIGGEGTTPTRTDDSGRVLPGALDRARIGFIRNNTVDGVSTLNNAAYGYSREWAAAIYVDGGSRIEISGNDVRNAPWAYEIGAENCVFTTHITMTDNGASGSWFGDLVFGGYAEGGFRQQRGINCDPNWSNDTDEGHGYVNRLTIRDNRFASSDTREDPILPQYRVRGALVMEFGVSPVNADGNGWAPGDQNAIRTSDR